MSPPSFVKKRPREVPTFEIPIDVEDEEAPPPPPTKPQTGPTTRSERTPLPPPAKQPTGPTTRQPKKGKTDEASSSQAGALGEMAGCHVSEAELARLAAMSPNRATDGIAQHLVKATFMYLSRARQMQLAAEADRAKDAELEKVKGELEALKTSSKKEVDALKNQLKKKDRDAAARDDVHKKAVEKIKAEKSSELSSLQKTLGERDAQISKLKENLTKLKSNVNAALKKSHDDGWQAGVDDYLYDFVKVMPDLDYSVFGADMVVQVEEAKRRILADIEKQVAKAAAERAAANQAALQSGASTSAVDGGQEGASKDGAAK